MTARYLCAICVDRPAETLTDWEYSDGRVREIGVCKRCLEPVPDPIVPHDLAERVQRRKGHGNDHTLRDAILALVRQRREVTGKELQEVLDMTGDADRWTLTKMLSRMVNRGELVASWVDESDLNLGRRFQIPSGTPPTLVAGLAFLPTLAETFTTADAEAASGLVGHKLGPVIRALAAAGLIAKVAARYVSAGVVVPAVWRKTEVARAA